MGVRCSRARATTRWCSGDDFGELDRFANIVDRSCVGVRLNPAAVPADSWIRRLHDGFAAVAPIGSFEANAFGRHDMFGNVAEHARDQFLPYTVPVRAGDGLRVRQEGDEDSLSRVVRGGSHGSDLLEARCAYRMAYGWAGALDWIGVRPARVLDR